MRRQEAETAPTFGALWRRAAAALDRRGEAAGRDRQAGNRGVRDSAAGGGSDRRTAPGARRVLPVPVAAVLAVLALAALAVIVRPWDSMRGPAPAPRETRTAPLITAWRSPTDFLLRTPGEEVLRTTPSFGSGLPPLADAGLRPRRAARPRHETPTHRRS
jgi:hypothetical protein